VVQTWSELRHQMLCGVESPTSNELFRTSDFTAGFKLDQPNPSRNSKADTSGNELSFVIYVPESYFHACNPAVHG
jgi:hypothetical protein